MCTTSDNAKTFVGANVELKAAYRNWSAPKVVKTLSDVHETNWKFMSPASPHQGGIYEAAVKSAKHHIRRVIGEKHFSYEHFLNFLLKVEAVLNSRPIYAPTDDITDELVITPGHFLIGEAPVIPPPIASPKVTNYSLQRIREEQRKMFDHFWKRWKSDYLSSLLPRKKWLKEEENVKIGQVVLLVEEDLSPGQWLMGKICELLPGRDGKIRNVVIEMSKRKKPKGAQTYGLKKKLTRSIQKLCILPTEPLEIWNSENLEE